MEALSQFPIRSLGASLYTRLILLNPAYRRDLLLPRVGPRDVNSQEPRHVSAVALTKTSLPKNTVSLNSLPATVSQ